MRMALSRRVEKLERAAWQARLLLIHVAPGRTVAQAMAAYRRAHGPIPPGAKLVLIHHTFVSTL
jgi:hypothetical protein